MIRGEQWIRILLVEMLGARGNRRMKRESCCTKPFFFLPRLLLLSFIHWSFKSSIVCDLFRCENRSESDCFSLEGKRLFWHWLGSTEGIKAEKVDTSSRSPHLKPLRKWRQGREIRQRNLGHEADMLHCVFLWYTRNDDDFGTHLICYTTPLASFGLASVCYTMLDCFALRGLTLFEGIVFVAVDWTHLLVRFCCGCATATSLKTRTLSLTYEHTHGMLLLIVLTGWKNVKLWLVGVISGNKGNVTLLPSSSTDSYVNSW